MTYFITIAGRRWPVEITFKTGKDTLGWDTSQARTWDAICRDTALTALAELRTAAIRAALTGTAAAPATGPDTAAAGQHTARSTDADTDAAFDLQFYRYGAPVPVRGGQPCPPGIPPIEMLAATLAARIERLALRPESRAPHHRPPRLPSPLVSTGADTTRTAPCWHHYAARLPALAT